jgi:hypothetical protein
VDVADVLPSVEGVVATWDEAKGQLVLERDAVGVRITRLPLSPERVMNAMDEAGVR